MECEDQLVACMSDGDEDGALADELSYHEVAAVRFISSKHNTTTTKPL